VATDTEELVPVPRSAVTLPLPLRPPDGFDPERPETWPRVEGQLEYVEGRLLWMPPSGDEQQDTCVDVVTVLNLWRRAHPEFRVGGNEAGMHLGEDSRGADAAVWRAADLGDYHGGYRRVPPVLAVEVAGKWDAEEQLRDKARWYLEKGVDVVWLLFPKSRRVLVLTSTGEQQLGPGDRLPPHAALPALEPPVDELFAQVSSG
jgi:Uma2 family endonuclease